MCVRWLIQRVSFIQTPKLQLTGSRKTNAWIISHGGKKFLRSHWTEERNEESLIKVMMRQQLKNIDCGYGVIYTGCVQTYCSLHQHRNHTDVNDWWLCSISDAARLQQSEYYCWVRPTGRHYRLCVNPVRNLYNTILFIGVRQPIWYIIDKIAHIKANCSRNIIQVTENVLVDLWIGE